MDLDCSAAGAPSPNYTWVAPPTSSTAGGPANRGPILRIPFTETSDSGLYACTVSNGIGEINRTLNLTVVGKHYATLCNDYIMLCNSTPSGLPTKNSNSSYVIITVTIFSSVTLSVAVTYH